MEKSQLTNQNTCVEYNKSNAETGNWRVSHYCAGLWLFRWLSFWAWQLISISWLSRCFAFIRACPAICSNHCL